MFNDLKQLSIFSKVFNVHADEWHKIFVIWILRFLHKFAFVIGWTLIVALFLGEFGLASLPYLFLINAIFSILGTFIFTFLIRRFSAERIMLAVIFLIGALMFASIYLYSYSLIAFLTLFLVVQSIFFVHFRILLMAFSERFFTPLESERTFPIIESAETFAGLIAGMVLLFLVDYIAVFKFVYLWLVAVFLLVPGILYTETLTERVALLSSKVKNFEVKTKFLDTFKSSLENKLHRRYIYGLLLVVFLQWFLFNLLEFQYTQAVYVNVRDVVLEGGSGFEHSFVHDLGALSVLFSVSSLLIQLFVGSRLINSLGVFKSMILHPLLTFLSILGLILNFGYSTAIFAKNNFTVSSVIANNAYHSAYYAVKERFRDITREFIEGIVRPFGAFFGTLAILLIQNYLPSYLFPFALNVSMLLITCILFYEIYLQQRKYTRLAIHDLVNSKTKETRLNAIDILAQKGHKNGIASLLSVLRNKDESLAIRVKIINSLAEIQNRHVIKDLIDCLGSKNFSIRDAAIDALLSFKDLQKQANQYLYLSLNVVSHLKKLYEHETNSQIRMKLIRLMSLLSGVTTIDFILKNIHYGDKYKRAEAIYNLGNYEDIALMQVVEPFLKDKDPLIQINAAIALGRFSSHYKCALKKIDQFLQSFDVERIALALYAIGELDIKRRKRDCLAHIYSQDLEVKINAALALAKMGFLESVPVLVDLLFHSDRKVSNKVRRALKSIHIKVYKNVDKIIKHIVSQRIDDILEKSQEEYLNFSQDKLKTLKWLYHLAEEYDEVENIKLLITN